MNGNFDENLYEKNNTPNIYENPSPMEEDIAVAETEGADTGPPLKRFGLWIPAAFAAAAVFFLTAVFSFQNVVRKAPGQVKMTENTETVRITEALKDDDNVTRLETEKEAGAQVQKSDTPETEDFSWQEIIFCAEGKSVITAPIRVGGLTQNERNLTGFRESDFIRGLSSFLTGNNIHVSGITFEEPLAISSDDAAAFSASLEGISDRKLIVIFFPAYPGKYLFALENMPKENETKGRTETQVTARASAAQTREAAQPQTQSVAVQVSSTDTESAYDAMSLTVKDLPSEVSNYLANAYELQYELYDYLYRRGITGAGTATVTDYYIDGDERTATIGITVEGVGDVTALYDRDENGYSFW